MAVRDITDTHTPFLYDYIIRLTGFGKSKMYQVLKYGEAKMKQLGKVIESQNVFLDSLTNVRLNYTTV